MARKAALIGAVVALCLVLLSERARAGLFSSAPMEAIGVLLGIGFAGAVPALIVFYIIAGLQALTRRKPID